jgi:hypothetical protein
MVAQRLAADHSLHTPTPPETPNMNPIASPATHARRVLTPLHELALLPLIDTPPAEPDSEFSRCGWFDSSLELAAGLQVIEFVDALPPGLPFELA